MTSYFFEEELRQWDSDLLKQKRKIVLLVDNCTAHPNLENLKSIKLVFLPPNATSVLQPLDQGVIRSLKSHYRKQLLMRILESYEKHNEGVDISLLEAVILLEKSWRQVTSATIRNCFRHAGLSKDASLEGDGATVEEEDDDDENLPIAAWLEKHGVNIFQREATEQFESFDDDVCTSGAPSDDEIVSEVLQKSNGPSENDTEDDAEEGASEIVTPSISEVRSAVNILNIFFPRKM